MEPENQTKDKTENETKILTEPENQTKDKTENEEPVAGQSGLQVP